MKIYSWNMFFSNKELERAFAFVAAAQFDVFCLQEVPAEFLKRLETLPLQIVSAPEVDRRINGTRVTNYLVVLSPHPLRDLVVWPLPYRERLLPLRGRWFTRFMYGIGLFVEGFGNRHNLRVDLMQPALGSIRIYNLHLPLMNPAWRAEEFEAALAERDRTRPTIVCGDFNVFESPHITILNWLLGGRVADALLWRRERLHIERRFVSHELSNALRGRTTHPLSQSQLDHILVSRDFSIKNAEVIRDRHGSDHHPISVETA